MRAAASTSRALAKSGWRASAPRSGVLKCSPTHAASAAGSASLRFLVAVPGPGHLPRVARGSGVDGALGRRAGCARWQTTAAGGSTDADEPGSQSPERPEGDAAAAPAAAAAASSGTADEAGPGEGESKVEPEPEPAPATPPVSSVIEEDPMLPVSLTPQDVCDRLDEYVVGQPDAKRAIAIALRNRWRRMRVESELKRRQLEPVIEAAVEEQLLQALSGGDKTKADTQASLRKLLRDGTLDQRVVQVELPVAERDGTMDVALPGGQSMVFDASELLSRMNPGAKARTQTRKLKVEEARPLLLEAELQKRLQALDVKKEAVRLAEQHGIVVIDEIDKI
ncbi:hslU, partial [Symbiodinium sp. KB8]